MPNLHRQKNFWEPTFEPKGSPLKEKYDWSTLQTNNGPSECICEPFTFSSIKANKIEKKKFNICDFNGDFKFDKTFPIKECEFIKCHFGRSNWSNIKFQKCTFDSSSFSMSQFERCQFIDCNFINISASANETVFINCLIDPSRFISNIQTNLNHPDILRERGITAQYQKYRLSKTKAKIAKNILNSLKELGYEDLFIIGIKVFSLQYIYSRISESFYFIRFGKWKEQVKHCFFIMPRFAELILISLFGALNRWGYSVGRITIIGFLIWILFSLLYYSQLGDLSISLLKSIDVTTLVGYSKYNLNELTTVEKIIHIANLFSGIAWYSLFFPTIFARTINRFD